INQIRAFLLKSGVAVRQGLRFLRAELPRILATSPATLSPRMLRVIEDLAGDWRRLDERIEGLSSEIEVLARHDPGCERLMSVPGIPANYLQRDGSCDRRWRRVLERPRLRRLAGSSPQANLDRRPHHPGQDIEARQSLPVGSVRSGRMGCIDQAEELGSTRAQVVARSGQEAAASQRPRYRTRQQARSHCLERPGSWANLRGQQDSARVIQRADS